MTTPYPPGVSTQVAKDLGISESARSRWLAQDDIDSGRKKCLSTSEREELTKLRRDNPPAGDGGRNPRARRSNSPAKCTPTLGLLLVQDLAAG